MKIATWNVNSLRARLQHVLDWLKANPVDVLALQELKLQEEQFPRAEIEALGYHTAINGQKTYNGVALLSRHPLEEVERDIPAFDDVQKRVIAATIRGVRVVSVYVPNGQAVGTEKYSYKLRWLEALRGWLRVELARYPKMAVLGDFNVAPDDRDVHDPVAWEGKVLCSELERGGFRGLLEAGFKDAFGLFPRAVEPAYTWWDYRQASFRRNLGLRIDHVLLSSDLANKCLSCHIDTSPRRLERPSDHAPVVVSFPEL
ncbi:MAG TPA: exodeoxyribonuclease III [Verrucomicrobiae bacterium]|nr:exodeoxyribonuclease III [Verrucomicrobiae bacterium]